MKHLNSSPIKKSLFRYLRGSFVTCSLVCMTSYLAMDCVRAQNANDMYKDSGNDRRRYDAIQQQNKQIIQGVFYQALLNGRLWRCESNVYLFYDGHVFVGSKDDTSDMGQVPFNIVGSYITKEEFITFVFPALPYDNTFELNTRTHDLYTFKSTNNKITKSSCKTIEREKK